MSIWTNIGFNGEMQAFLDLGELLISSDTAAALEAYRTVRAFVQSLLYFFPLCFIGLPSISFPVFSAKQYYLSM